jgi:hypothetical protein
MNEQRVAFIVRQALDESAERLPYRVNQRLERGRLSALERASTCQAVSIAPLGSAVAALGGDRQPSPWTRFVSTILPLLIVAAGLYGISVWNEAEDAADTADIDAELVLGNEDDVPVSALADKGFGVFIRNSRQ